MPAPAVAGEAVGSGTAIASGPVDMPITVIGFCALALLAGLVLSNRLWFAHGVRRDAKRIWSNAAAPHGLDREHFTELPPPIARYARKATGDRPRTIGTLHLRHGGTFRTKLDGAWLPIHGEQYFTADPPAFVWWGRVTAAPGVWFDVRDRAVSGVGSMLAKLESTFTVVDQSDETVDEGAMIRLLGELVWMPTALFDNRNITWSAIDAHHARATLRQCAHEVSCVFEIGQDDLPVAITADRYRDVDGVGVLTPWSVEIGDYREVDGLLIPFSCTVSWHVGLSKAAYARWAVESVEYDGAAPSSAAMPRAA